MLDFDRNSSPQMWRGVEIKTLIVVEFKNFGR